MYIEQIKSFLDAFLTRALHWATSPEFYSQCGLILTAIIIALTLSSALKKHVPVLSQPPQDDLYHGLKKHIYSIRELLFPLINIILLGAAVEISSTFLDNSWLIRIAQSLAVVFMLYAFINRFISKNLFKKLVKWIAIPIALLEIFGLLDAVILYLDSLSIELGNIRISVYALARVLIFGMVLFWLGRVSNSAGQQIIRSQEELDVGTREVFAKLFQVGVFFAIFLLLLQLMGINLTALAVFGGALGVGLGFGLQAIASNFISGIIILLDRSTSVGDYIEMEDGRSGVLRELNMRSAILETYDGKDIMVPNERFITSNFTNWTHKNKKQRYPITFSVAYDTDLDHLFELLREVVASHPQVLSGDSVPLEERPDAEIAGFGESGIDILVEFWMEDIDDGKNKVGADLMHMIWNALKENNIEIPYPKRVVTLIKE